MDRAALKQLVKDMITREMAGEETLIPIGVSNRHIHLAEADFRKLFPNEELTVMKSLKQPGEFAAEQTVTVVGKKGKLERVRILGPFRKVTQLEVSKTDARTLGLDVPIRMSGDIAGTPGVTLQTPHGEVTLTEGVIVAKRHIHVPTDVAPVLGVTHGQAVSVHLTSKDRSLTLDECMIRVSDNFALEMHIDTDEANAADVGNTSFAKIVDR